MPKLSPGDDAPPILLPAIDGSTFDINAVRGKKVILTFFRFSTCPLCNMRIRKIKQRWDEFSNDVIMIGVFDAGIADLTKRMEKHDVPFTIVADEDYEFFSSNGVSKSFGKFMRGAAKSPLTLLQATLRGYIPLTMSFQKLSTIPVDVLIDETGKVVEAHYCKDTADHMPLEKMIAFSHGTLEEASSGAKA